MVHPCPYPYGASEPVEKDGHLACFAEHAVSTSTFLDTQEFFQEAEMKDVCTGGYWGIICQWKSGPYLTSVQARCQSQDLEKPQHGMFSVCDTLARTGSVNSSYREPQIETKSDTNLRSLYECWFKNALISKSVILWWQVKKGIR